MSMLPLHIRAQIKWETFKMSFTVKRKLKRKQRELQWKRFKIKNFIGE